VAARVLVVLLPGVEVDVDVDQAGRDVVPGHVDGLEGTRRGDVRGDERDAAVLDGDVADGAQAVARVDDVAPFEQQVELLRGGDAGQGDEGEEQDEASHERSPLWLLVSRRMSAV